jgi:phosphopantothenoylcysteine synthetase/decarboxylase
VANDVSAEGAGFGHDTNAVHIVARHGTVVEVGLADKRTVAVAVVDAIIEGLGAFSPDRIVGPLEASPNPTQESL